MYVIYFILFGIISYKTNLGFEYTNGFELLWGSFVVVAVTWIIDTIIFKLAYDWTGFLSELLEYNVDDRKTTHWKFRALFSIPVLIFSLTPLCSVVMTPLVHSTYIWISGQCNNLLTQITDILSPK